MQDRQPGKPGQYKATLTAEEFEKLQAGQQFTITLVRDDQPIVEGTPYSKAAVLPDELASKLCPDVSNPSPADALGALLSRNRCHGSLKDIGITTFPTTMATVVSKMPANSMIVIDTRRINGTSADTSTETISDWGSSINGMALIMKGYSTARVSMIIVYGSSAATVTQFHFGNYAVTTDTVNWSRCASYDNFVDFVKKTSPRNLLDNSDFRNPVNQRGLTSYAYVDKTVLTIDRWQISSETCVVNVEDGYISKVGSMGQMIAGLDKNKTYTAVVCSQDGTVSCYCGTIANGIGSWYDNAYVYSGTEDLTIFSLPARGYSEIQWAALYEGEYTAETLPEYKSKGYAAELAECMRYYQKFGSLQIPATPYSATSILLTPPCKIEMRLKPTLTVTNMSHLRCGGETISTFPTYTVAVFGGSPESPNFTMTFESDHGLPLANAGFLYMAGELRADL